MQDQKAVEEQKFCSYIFNLILNKGGVKMHMSIADITKEMQALDPKDSVNHFRKRFGNMDQCLREIQNPFYTIDNHIVITFKPHDQIIQLHSQGHINEEDFKLYEKGKRAPGEQKFLTYIFRLILKKGGLRMLMVTGDITKDMQTLDAKDDINLHRKRYGNMDQCLKDIKNPFYIIDSMVIKFKPYNEIVSLHQQGHILDEDFKYYEQVYAENELKRIQVLKINGLNECINCGQEYKMIVNQDRSCEATQDKHQPKHKY